MSEVRLVLTCIILHIEVHHVSFQDLPGLIVALKQRHHAPDARAHGSIGEFVCLLVNQAGAGHIAEETDFHGLHVGAGDAVSRIVKPAPVADGAFLVADVAGVLDVPMAKVIVVAPRIGLHAFIAQCRTHVLPELCHFEFCGGE